MDDVMYSIFSTSGDAVQSDHKLAHVGLLNCPQSMAETESQGHTWNLHVSYCPKGMPETESQGHTCNLYVSYCPKGMPETESQGHTCNLHVSYCPKGMPETESQGHTCNLYIPPKMYSNPEHFRNTLTNSTSPKEYKRLTNTRVITLPDIE
jgi:hypothetical protein